MKQLKRLTISILFGFVFLTVITAQIEAKNDTIKHPIKLKEKNTNQFQLNNNQYKIKESTYEDRSINDLPNLNIQPIAPENLGEKQLDQSSLIQIGESTNEAMYGSESLIDFSFMYSDDLYFNTSFMIGRVATPFAPDGVNYFNVNIGSEFYINPYLTGTAGLFYKSTLEHPSSIMGGYLGTIFTPFDKLTLSNTLSYHNHMSNDSQFNQQSIMLDIHARYKLSEKYYSNFYGGAPLNERNNNSNIVLPGMPKKYVGGTVEFWINPKVGIESGVIWEQDVFNHTLIPKPVMGLKIDRSRKR